MIMPAIERVIPLVVICRRDPDASRDGCAILGLCIALSGGGGRCDVVGTDPSLSHATSRPIRTFSVTPRDRRRRLMQILASRDMRILPVAVWAGAC